LKHEVKMVGLEAEPKDVDRKLGFGSGEQVEESLVVPIRVENESASVPAVKDVVGVTAVLSTERARHQTVRHVGVGKG